jgi:hypothetical protein
MKPELGTKEPLAPRQSHGMAGWHVESFVPGDETRRAIQDEAANIPPARASMDSLTIQNLQYFLGRSV